MGGAAAAATIKYGMLVSGFIMVMFSMLLLVGQCGVGPPSFMAVLCWIPPPLLPSSAAAAAAASRNGYSVVINTWKRPSLLKQAVAHYATCTLTDAIHVVWSETDPPSDTLRAHLTNTITATSQNSNNKQPNFRFELNQEDSLNNRFKPMEHLKNDAVFSVDDDVIVPCTTLDYAFSVWQAAPNTMVGFVPRMHWLDQEEDGATYYRYGGWWSVWWMGTYSMILSKAAFFHRKYLDMYTYDMPPSIHGYVTRERNCEDIAMSLLVANATGSPRSGFEIHEIGLNGISSLKRHSEKRRKCLNDFISLYGTVPLVSTNIKAVDARKQWFW